jgi:hypothetical protein
LGGSVDGSECGEGPENVSAVPSLRIKQLALPPVEGADVLSDERRQLRSITIERLNGGAEHIRLTDVFPRDVATVCVRQMADEFPLRSPVSFTERVERVQLAKVIRGASAESGLIEPGECFL